MKSLEKKQTAPFRGTRKFFRALLGPAVACAIPGAALVAFLLLRSNKTAMNFLIYHVTTPLKHALSGFCGHLPFALAEVLWVVAAVVVVWFLARTVYLLIRRPGRLVRLCRRILAAGCAVLLVACGYTYMWGINYYGDSFSELSGLTERGATAQELYTLTVAFADACSARSSLVSRDSNGVCNQNVAAMFTESDGLYAGMVAEFPFLAAPERETKPMFFSHLISYTGFTGFFFPMTAESLINNDCPPCLIPATILHELAHQRNVATEQAANFTAILTGIRCDDPVFQYSSLLLGYIHLSNALYSADESLWKQAATHLNDQVSADIADNNAYWAKFESPVEKTSEKVYTGFLDSYGQTDGLKSYGECVDLLAAYYFDVHPELLADGTL